jgi:uncharacterized repeat protein (TIGR01451 family)
MRAALVHGPVAGFDDGGLRVLRCGTARPASRFLIAICLLVTAGPWHHARAQEEVPVETTLIAETLEKMDLADGRQSQRLVPAGVIAQGEVVYYTLMVRNSSMQPARNVAVVQRIPANTTYVPNTASGPSVDITFSIDAGQTFKSPRELEVVAATGAKRPATPEDYTHIRWKLRYVLAPGAVAFMRFQAVFR